MQRFAAVWHASPQKMVGVLFALLLAAMMAVGSGANFNSTSASPGNVVTAGILSHSNSAGTAATAILKVSKLKPGQSDTGTVKITNTGNVDGVFSVARTIDRDTTNTLTPPNPFAAHLKLKIVDLDAPPATSVVYDGLLSAMTGTRGAATIQPGAGNAHTFDFTVTFVDGNAVTPTVPNGADNAFQAAEVEATFNWEGVTN